MNLIMDKGGSCKSLSDLIDESSTFSLFKQDFTSLVHI